MRENINLNTAWRFHKGDIAEPIPQDKGFIYSKAKPSAKDRALRRIITLTLPTHTATE